MSIEDFVVENPPGCFDGKNMYVKFYPGNEQLCCGNPEAVCIYKREGPQHTEFQCDFYKYQSIIDYLIEARHHEA